MKSFIAEFIWWVKIRWHDRVPLASLAISRLRFLTHLISGNLQVLSSIFSRSVTTHLLYPCQEYVDDPYSRSDGIWISVHTISRDFRTFQSSLTTQLWRLAALHRQDISKQELHHWSPKGWKFFAVWFVLCYSEKKSQFKGGRQLVPPPGIKAKSRDL